MKLQRDSWKVGRLLAVSFGIALLAGLCIAVAMIIDSALKNSTVSTDGVLTVTFIAIVGIFVVTIPSGLLFAALANGIGWLNTKTAVITAISTSLLLISYFVFEEYQRHMSLGASGNLYGDTPYLMPILFGLIPMIVVPMFYKFYIQHVYQPIKDATSK